MSAAAVSHLTISHLISEATNRLLKRDVDSARLDVLLLLEEITGQDRSGLLAHPEHLLTADQLTQFNELLERRARHEPLAYILGWREFYGRRFIVNHHVMVPRPESETMISCLLKLNLPPKVNITDVGTGSGALGITAALELPTAAVELIDMSPESLPVAAANADRHQASVILTESDLLTDARLRPDVLLGNLPYVPENYPVNRAARHEPELALFGGEDGLAVYRRLFMQLSGREQRPQWVLTESLTHQHQTMAGIAGRHGYQLRASDGLIQVYEVYEPV